MDKLLQLSENLFKKIFKLNLKEAKSTDVQRKDRQGTMPPPMPDRNQDKFPDRPPMRIFFNEVPMRPHPQPLQNPEKLKKEARKREKKLKKILTKSNIIHGKSTKNQYKAINIIIIKINAPRAIM